jgi:hypothetical protein
MGELQIGSCDKIEESAWYKTLRIEDETLKFKLDTGAETNVLPLHVYDELERKPMLQKTNTILSTYGDHRLKPKGKVILKCENQDRILRG